MLRTYDTGAAEERALTYIASLRPLGGTVETADDVFARFVQHALRGLVQQMRAARDQARADAYAAADPATQATIDAALKVGQ